MPRNRPLNKTTNSTLHPPYMHEYCLRKSEQLIHFFTVSNRNNFLLPRAIVHPRKITNAEAKLTSPSVERLLLMLDASRNRSPLAPVALARSLPARSTRQILLVRELRKKRRWAATWLQGYPPGRAQRGPTRSHTR